MKNLIGLICLLSFSVCSAQLYVENSAYVFVNNEILTVTDYVNLNDLDSKLYLRNESQLLQINNIGNTGIGELSIRQRGTVDGFEYNYWCSPIGNNSAITGNENFRVDLIDEATGLISSTNSLFTNSFDGTANPFRISDRWLWTFVVSDEYAEWAYVGPNGNISPGFGFTMKGTNGTNTTDIDGSYGSEVLNGGDNQSYEFRGKPNNGTITNAVAAEQFTLVGNPYPSAMDSAAYIHDTQNLNAITGTLFYWEQDTSVNSHTLQDYVGGYSEFTINAAGDMITTAPATFFTYDENDNIFALPPPGAMGSKVARRYIPVGQGFMVEGSLSTTGSVRTTNAMRAYEKESDGESYFFRTEEDSYTTSTIQYQDNGLTIVPEDYRRFRINVDFSVSNTDYTRQLILNFHDSATMEFDYGLELHRSDNLDSDAYFSYGEEAFSGQAFPFSQDLAISLNIDIEQQQPLRFRIFDIQNFEDTQAIYIHDIYNDIYINLRQQDYEINIEEGSYTDRFEIVFVEEDSLSVVENDLETIKIIQDNSSSQLVIQNPNGLTIKSLSLIDVGGKQVLNDINLGNEDSYKYSTVSLSEGVYLATVVLDNNASLSKKVIVSQ